MINTNELSPPKNCDVLITGASSNKSISFYHAHTEEKLKFNKVILGVDGIDINRGISTHYEPEAIFNRVMCESAEMVIVVTNTCFLG